METQNESQHGEGLRQEVGEATMEHKFQDAISSWRRIDLSGAIPKFDETAAQIMEQQKVALVQRKELADSTKNFRKLDDEKKLGEFMTLLKSYQKFVDLLTNNGKTASSAFLQIYTSLAEAPDPYPLLEASVESVAVSQDTMPKLTAENEELKRQSRRAKEEVESLQSQLEHERAARIKIETAKASSIAAAENSWQEAMKEKTDNWAAKEAELEQRVSEYEAQLKEVKANLEVSNLLDSEGKKSSAGYVNTAEFELTNSMLERTTNRLAEVEARNEQMKVQLAKLVSDNQSAGTVTDHPDFLRLQNEHQSLLQRLEKSGSQLDDEKARSDSTLTSQKKEITKLRDERADLRARMEAWQDYPELKRELEVFRALEFSAEDNGDEVVKGADEGKDSLERLLMQKNRKLGDDLAELRVAQQKTREELDLLQATYRATSEELVKSQKLNQTLENDLLSFQEEASNTFAFSAKSTTSRFPHTPGSFRGRRHSPTSSIISGFDNQRSPFDTMSIRDGDGGASGSGILPMVQAQRDRFKQKVSQLEAELQKQYTIVSSLRQEVASLQKDNLNLYEKTRYVSSFQRGAQTTSSSTVTASAAAVENGTSLNQYRDQYEAKISPFAAFRGLESHRAYKRMSSVERGMLALTRVILANRISRNLFALYWVVLHFAIFFLIYDVETVGKPARANPG